VHQLGHTLAARGVQLATKNYLHPLHSYHQHQRSQALQHALSGLSPAEVVLVEAHLVRCTKGNVWCNAVTTMTSNMDTCTTKLPKHFSFVQSSTQLYASPSYLTSMRRFLSGLLCSCLSGLSAQCDERSCSASPTLTPWPSSA